MRKQSQIIPSLRQQEHFSVSLTTTTLQHFPGSKPCSQDGPSCKVIKAEMKLMKQNYGTLDFNVFRGNRVTSWEVRMLVPGAVERLFTLDPT